MMEVWQLGGWCLLGIFSVISVHTGRIMPYEFKKLYCVQILPLDSSIHAPIFFFRLIESINLISVMN